MPSHRSCKLFRGLKTCFILGNNCQFFVGRGFCSKMASAMNENGNGEKKQLMKQLDNYILVDIGANLTNKKFARDLDSVIQRAKQAGKI